MSLSKINLAIICAIACVGLFAFALADESSAQTYEGTCGTDLTWSLDTDSGELTISGPGTTMTDYDYQDALINPTLAPWMAYKDDIRYVTFDTINLERIGNGAFKNLTDLSYVLMPDTVTRIGSSAFENCTSMSISYMPSTLKIVDARAFYNCSSVGGMNFPNELEYLGAYGFAFNDSRFYLTKLPDTLTYIGSHAFEGWSMDWGVVQLPNTTVNIYERAFETSGVCDSVYLPPNFKLGPQSYNSFVGMNPVHIYNYSTNYNLTLGSSDCGHIAENTSKTKLIQQGNNGTLGTGLSWTYLPSTHTVRITGSGTTTPDIQEHRPNSNTNQIMVVPWYGLMNDVKAIEFNTPNLATLGKGLFSKHTALENIVIPRSVTKMKSGMFEGCTALKSVEIANPNVDMDGQNMFYRCTSLTDVALPGNLTTLATLMFGGCTSLVDLDIPNTVTVIKGSAFSGCTSLNLTKLPTGLATIETNAFKDCKALALTELPDSITSIGTHAFEGCTRLALTKLPQGLTEVSDYAFASCTNMALTEIPSNITKIGNYAFSSNLGITQLKVPKSLTDVKGTAFNYCRNLSVVFNESSMNIVPGGSECGGVAKYADAVVKPVIGIQKVDKEQKIDEPYVNMLLVIPTFLIIGIILVVLSYMGIRRGSFDGGSEYDRI